MNRRWRILLGGLALAFVAGCTGSGDSNQSALRKADQAYQETFYYRLNSEPASLNPITSSDYYQQVVESYVMDSLLSKNLDTWEWQPALAESFEIAGDGRTFTFKLRKNAKWQDGKPVTPEDIKFSVDVYFLDEYAAFHRRPYYESVRDIKIIDEHTVQIKAADTYYKNFDVVAGMPILPKHIYENAEEGSKINKDLIGSGPYRITRYDKGRQLTLEKNPDWWGWTVDTYKEKYRFPRITMRFAKEDNVALQMLKKGEIDYLELTSEDYEKKTSGPEWGETVFKFQVENKAPKRTSFVAWNFKNELFQSRNVRVALSHLMNREEMNQKFTFGKSLLATGPWYQQNDAADPAVKPIPFDPDKAMELLKGDGWVDSDKDGVLDKTIDGQKRRFEFTLLYPNKDTEKYWVFYQRDLEKAGIKMNLQYLEWNSFTAKLDGQDFDAITLSWTGVIDYDPKQIWHSSSAEKGGSNFISYKNPEVDKLIDTARTTVDPQKRIQLLRQVYRKIAEDAPYTFLFNPKYDLYANTARMGKPKDTFTYDIGLTYWWIKNEQMAKAVPQ